MKYLSIKHPDTIQIINIQYIVSVYYVGDDVTIDYLENGELMELETKKENIAEVDTLVPTVKVRQSNVSAILNKVAQIYDIPLMEITGSARTTSVVKARHIAMWLCCNLTERSTTEIGRFFGTDHSSVIYGRDRAEKEFRSELDDLLALL